MLSCSNVTFYRFPSNFSHVSDEGQVIGLWMGIAGGERVWKLTGQVQQMHIHGGPKIDVVDLNNKTLYVSPYLVFNEQGYSKHYYAGAERVSSRIGGGMQDALVDPVNYTVAIFSGQEYPAMADDLLDMLGRSIECTDMPMQYVSMEQRLGSIEEYTNRNDPEDNRYIYHSDHLGSSAFLTDANGIPTQHLQYLPFGEPFIEQRSFTEYYTPYTFSAKERDTETGYSYFGARYYNSQISVWLSVDPLSDKYPSMSAYMYVGGYPTIITDPDGRDWFQDEEGNYVFDKNVTKDTKLKEGQKYLGPKYKIDVVNSEEQYQYSFHLNEDGTFNDTKGNNWGIGSEFDPELKSGNKIISRFNKELSSESNPNDLTREGYTYVPHEDVGRIMSTNQGKQTWAVSGILGALGLTAPFMGVPLYLLITGLGAVSEIRADYYAKLYELYSVNGGGEGVYYKDRSVYSNDQINVYRDIIFKNGQGRCTTQPY